MSTFSSPILALDTTVGAAACIWMPDGKSFTASMSQSRAHSREILPMLQHVLQKADLTWQDMGAFAVSVGPGSFTGLRVACATMAGINASLRKPMYSLCSLSVTALQIQAPTSIQAQHKAKRQTQINTPFWAIEDARSKLVYAAEFAADGQPLQAARCLSWDEFLTIPPSAYVSLSDVPIALPNWQALPIQQPREEALLAAVRVLDIEQDHALWLEPVYLQASQAEKNLA